MARCTVPGGVYTTLPLLSVRKMPACWLLTLLLTIPEAPAEVVNIENKWRQYRNIVRGGFFFNDSVIVLADYTDDEDTMISNSQLALDNKDVKIETPDANKMVRKYFHQNFGIEN